MTPEAVGAQMPTQITLDNLAVMAAADENHRYELSPEGVLSVAPPADPDHALLVSRMFAWFMTHGYGPKQVVALIPGDPDAIAANAVALRQRAADAADAGDGLRAIDTGAWTGPAAQRFHDKFSYEPGRWFTAADAMQAGAGALDDYVATLRWAQGQAAEALGSGTPARLPPPRHAPDTSRHHRRRSRSRIPARQVAQPRRTRWLPPGNRYAQLLRW